MITILSGYQFQVSVYINWMLNNKSWQKYENEKINIISGTIKSRWRADIKNKLINHKFRLTVGKPLNDLIKLKRFKFLKDLDDSILRLPSKKNLLNSRIVYGLANYSKNSFQYLKENKKDNKLVLDRACSHINLQLKLLDEEYKKFDLRFEKKEFNKQLLIDEYNLADQIVVPSTKTLNSFIDEGFPKEKLIKISLTSNFKKNYDPIKKKLTKDQNDKFVVGFLGGSFIRKGLIYLLNAWDKLNTSQSILILKIEKNNVLWNDEAAKIIKRNDNIYFLNEYLNDITEFYKSIDLFCLPSIEEGFGMSVIEAYYYNCKIICSDAVGASDLIMKKNGVELFSNKNIHDLASKLEIFIKQGKKKGFINKNYNIKNSSEDYLNIYK